MVAALSAACVVQPEPEPESAEALLLIPTPADGATDVFFGTTIEARFDGTPSDPVLVLREGLGDEVDGTASTDASGRRVVFEPDAPLRPSTAYQASVREHADAAWQTWTFETGPYGEPIERPAALPGQVFVVDLWGGDVVAPETLGAILDTLLIDTSFLAAVTADSDLAAGIAHLELTRGDLSGAAVVQDPCAVTSPVTWGPDASVGTADDLEATWDDPGIQVAGDLPIATAGGVATLESGTLSAVFSPDLAGFAGGTFAGRLDTRGLAIGSVGGASACDLLADTAAIECVPCADGDVSCVEVAIEAIRGRAVEGRLERVTCADVIDRDLAGAASGESWWTCKDDAQRWWAVDEAGDRVGDGYPGCPQWAP